MADTETDSRCSARGRRATGRRALIGAALLSVNAAHAGFKAGDSLVDMCSEPRAMCLTYLMGVVDGIDAMGWEAVDPPLCVPDKVEDYRIRDLFLEYADNHPEHLHLPAGLLVLAALKRDWACRAQ